MKKQIIEIANTANQQGELSQNQIRRIKDFWSDFLKKSNGNSIGDAKEIIESLKPILKKEIKLKQKVLPLSYCFLIINSLKPFNKDEEK